MGQRVHPWRNNPPAVVAERMEQCLHTQMFLLSQSGPLGFIVKCGEKKHRGLRNTAAADCAVFLGSENSCNCPSFLKDKELCIHILWVILKKLRVPKENSLVYQLSLGECCIPAWQAYLLSGKRDRPNLARQLATPRRSGRPACTGARLRGLVTTRHCRRRHLSHLSGAAIEVCIFIYMTPSLPA